MKKKAKDRAVIIRISDEARSRLKVNAVKLGFKSMMAYIDALSREKLDKSVMDKISK